MVSNPWRFACVECESRAVEPTSTRACGPRSDSSGQYRCKVCGSWSDELIDLKRGKRMRPTEPVA